MLKYLIVFVGSGIGGGLRFWLSSLVHKYFPPFFPLGTLIINILGSFILGYMIKLFIGIGFCGGFTTFSTFSLETFNLIRNSEFLFAGINILASVLVSLLGVYLAYLVTR